jgi:3-hydroxyisobutyrate dehydrogenase
MNTVEVAVLGTGTMGVGVVHSLLRAGFGVRAWNRTAAKAQPLAGDGAIVAATAAEAISGADVVITLLFDADAVVEVVSQAAGAFGPETVWLQSATVGLDGTARVKALADEHGLKVLDAPVLGTKAPAEQGKLIPLVSGDPALRARVQPVLDAIGTRTIWAGDALGQGSALKLACNAWVASINAAVAQSLAVAGALQIEPSLFLEAISGGPSDTPYAQLKGKQMLAGDFTPSFAVDGVVKDVGLITDAAQAAGVDSALLMALRSLYAEASRNGLGEADMAAVYTVFLPR